MKDLSPLDESNKFRDENSLIIEILNTLPYTAVILNNKREILYANPISINSNLNLTIDEFIGKKTGEAFNCLHFTNNVEECGETSQCKFCGTANVIIKSQDSKKKETQESRISRIIDGIEYSFEFEVTSSPFNWNNTEYILLTMLDVSGQKRKKALERIFFHDILNKTGSLSGFFQLLKQSDDTDNKDELLDIAESISWDLSEEIIAQKQLIAAEDGELILNETNVNSKDIIDRIVKQLSKFGLFKNYSISINTTCSINFKTDETLLKRILMNMLKNAIEASDTDELITFGCTNKDSLIRFYVHNKAVIEEDIQLQIFQRSFSTKGMDRGLGTYSMKILGERYLNGQVNFISNPEEGTTFFIDIPTNK